MVNSPNGLNVREFPFTTSRRVKTLPDGARVPILERVQGESVEGDTLWFRIATRQYVTARYVEPTCAEGIVAPPEASDVDSDNFHNEKALA